MAKRRAIAIELGSTQIRGALITDDTLTEEFPCRDPEPLGPNPEIDTTCDRVYRVAETILKEAGLGWEEIEGVGVGVPNPINEEGIVRQVVNLPWPNVRFGDRLRQKFPRDTKVAVLNDGNCAALAEARYWGKKGDPHQTIVVYYITAGIGGGIVIDGRLRVGTSGCAGEIGHVMVNPRGPWCWGCKLQHGCVETYAGGQAIARSAAQLIVKGRGGEAILDAVRRRETKEGNNYLDVLSVDGGAEHFEYNAAGNPERHTVLGRDVRDVAGHGDPDAKKIMHDAGQWLGKAMVQLIHILAPQMIVVTGFVTQVTNVYMEAARDWVMHHAFSEAFNECSIQASTLQDRASLYGAAAAIFRMSET